MKTSRILIATAALFVIGGGALGWSAIEARRAQLDLGVGYAARVGCACRYIGNRSLADCRRDFEPGMELITLSDDPATRSVTASVPLIARRTATHDRLLGCQPDVFRGTPHKVRD